MKNTYIAVLFIICGFITSNAQDEDFIAATGGFSHASTTVNTEGILDKSPNLGFYLGFLTEVYISHEIWLQSELIYANVNDNSYVQLPILAKFYVSNKVNLLAGPQISYTLENVNDNYSKFNLGASIGIGYNFTEKIIMNTRYTFQINDYYTGNGDFSLKTRFFNVGLAYKFKAI